MGSAEPRYVMLVFGHLTVPVRRVTHWSMRTRRRGTRMWQERLRVRVRVCVCMREWRLILVWA